MLRRRTRSLHGDELGAGGERDRQLVAAQRAHHEDRAVDPGAAQLGRLLGGRHREHVAPAVERGARDRRARRGRSRRP